MSDDRGAGGEHACAIVVIPRGPDAAAGMSPGTGTDASAGVIAAAAVGRVLVGAGVVGAVGSGQVLGETT